MVRRDTAEYPRIVFEDPRRRVVEIYSGGFDFERLLKNAMGESYWYTDFVTRSYVETEKASQWLHGWALDLSEEIDSVQA